MNERKDPGETFREVLVLKTEDLKNAYQNLSASSFPKESAIRHKKNIISETRVRNLLPEDVLKQYPTVYAGSGTDIEYPLCLGSRKIIMVDPLFIDESAKEEVDSRIGQITGEGLQKDGDTRTFQFDFGSGKESVTVEYVGADFTSKVSESSQEHSEPWMKSVPDIGNEDADEDASWMRPIPSIDKPLGEQEDDYQPQEPPPSFVPPAQIGMLLTFKLNFAQPDSNPQTIDNLVSGGMILSDAPIGHTYEIYQPKALTHNVDDIRAAYQAEGKYQFIKLESGENNPTYTFVQKN